MFIVSGEIATGLIFVGHPVHGTKYANKRLRLTKRQKPTILLKRSRWLAHVRAVFKNIFSFRFNSSLLTKAVDRTNMMYGELNIRESRTAFVQGSIDPWHALGITEARTNNTVSIYIDGKFDIKILIVFERKT